MSTIKKGIYDKIKDLTIEKLIALLILLSGASVASIATLTKETWKKHFLITFGEIVNFFASEIVVVLLIVLGFYKLKSRRIINAGSKVILSTDNGPVMSAGRYNFLNNKIYCSWVHDRDVKNQWINQTQLKEYTPPPPRPSSRGNSTWDRDRSAY